MERLIYLYGYCCLIPYLELFIYLWFYIVFNNVQVISQWVVGRAEETSTYSSSGFCKLPKNGKQLPAISYLEDILCLVSYLIRYR